MAPRAASCVEGRDKGGVDSELDSSPKREPVGDNLNSPVVVLTGDDVEIAQQDICSDCGSSFPAYARSSAFQRNASPAEEPSAWAGGPVIAERVKMGTTTAGGSIKRQWKAESPEQENTKCS